MRIALVLQEWHYESTRHGLVSGEEIDALGMQKAFLRRNNVSQCDILTSNIISYLSKHHTLPQYDLAIHFFLPTLKLPGSKNVLFFQQFWEHFRHDVRAYLGEFDAVMTNSYHLANAVPGVILYPLAVDLETYHPVAPDGVHRCQLLLIANFRERGPEAYSRYLRPALGLDLAIYGNDWDDAAAGDYTAAWRGLLPHQRACHAYCAADLSLSIAVQKQEYPVHWQLISSRIFHSLACHRMVVSDPFPHLQETFPEGEGVVYVNGGEHSREIMERYLHDEVARQQVARAGATRVAAHHTWDARVQYLLDQLGYQ